LREGILLPPIEAISGWAQGSQMDAPSFAHHFFQRDADDPIVTSLRSAAVGAKTATPQDQLAADGPKADRYYTGQIERCLSVGHSKMIRC